MPQDTKSPNVRGLVNDPDFSRLDTTQQRQVLSRLTNDQSFQSVSDAQLGEFVSKMRSQGQPALPKIPTAIAPKPTSNGSSLSARLGSYIPDWTVPGLSAINKYAVQPFERMSQAGGKIGAEALKDVAGSMATHPLTTLKTAAESRMGIPPSPQDAQSVSSGVEAFEKNHPVVSGIAGGVGQVAGSIAADPRMWALGLGRIGSATVEKLMARGFGLQQLYSAARAIPQAYKAITEGRDEDAAQMITEAGISGGLGYLGTTAKFKPEAAPAKTSIEVSATTDEPGDGGGVSQTAPAPIASARHAEAQISETNLPEEFTRDQMTNLANRAKTIVGNPKATAEEKSAAQSIHDTMQERLNTLAQPKPSEPVNAAPTAPHPAELAREAAPIEKPTEPALSTETLPRDLAGSKPRFGHRDQNFQLQFENSVDKALFTVAQEHKNIAHDRFMDFLQKRFPDKTPGQIIQMGRDVRVRIKGIAANAYGKDTDTLTIPKSEFLSQSVKAPATAAPHPLDKKIANVPTENLPALRDELRSRAAELQAQTKNIRDLDQQFSKNADNAKAIIDMKSTGGPVRQIVNPEGERVAIKPEAELGAHARNFLQPLEGKAPRFSREELQSDKFDRKPPAGNNADEWKSALQKVKEIFFRRADALQKDIHIANDTGASLDDAHIPERLKELDSIGGTIWNLPKGEIGARKISVAPAPEQALRTWDIKSQEAATGKNIKNFNNGKLLNSKQLEDIAQKKEQLAQEHLELANHIDTKLNNEPIRVEHNAQGDVVSADGRHRVIAAMKRGDKTIPVSVKLADSSVQTLNVPPEKVAAKIGVTPESLKATDEAQSQFNPPAATKSPLEAAQERIAANTEVLRKSELANPKNINKPSDVQKVLLAADEGLVHNEDPRITQTLTRDARKKLAADMGMSEEDVLSQFPGVAANAERIEAMQEVLKNTRARLIPKAKDAVVNAKKLDDFIADLAKHNEVVESFRNVAAKEAGRALQAIGPNDAFDKAIKALQDLPLEAKKQAALRFAMLDFDNPGVMERFAKEITPSSTAAKIYEAWINSMLSGAAAVTKLVSDVTLALSSLPNALVTGWVSHLTSKLIGRPQERFAGEAFAQAHGMLAGVQRGFETFMHVFKTEISATKDWSGQDFRVRQTAIKGKLGRFVRTPIRLLMAITDGMHMMNYSGRLEAVAWRDAVKAGLNPLSEEGRAFIQERKLNPTTAAKEEAWSFAERQTLRENFDAPGWWNNIMRAALNVKNTEIGKVLSPFLTTPANALRENVRYSPLGFAGTVKGGFKGDLRGGEFSENLAKNLIGTGAFLFLFDKALQGRITGSGPSDPKAKATLMATGWQPNSIKVGDKYISYRKLIPAFMTLASVANLAEYHKQNPNASTASTIMPVLGNTLKSATGLPFLNSITELMNLFGGGTQKESISQAASYEAIPAGVRNIANLIDPRIRKAQTAAQQFEANLPVLSRNVPAKTDVTGQPIKSSPLNVGGFNPFTVSPVTHNAVAGEVSRLQSTKTQTGPTVTVPRVGLPSGAASMKVSITQGEKIVLDHQDQQLTAARKKVLMDNPLYSHLSDDQKREAFSRIDRNVSETRYSRLLRLRANPQ